MGLSAALSVPTTDKLFLRKMEEIRLTLWREDIMGAYGAGAATREIFARPFALLSQRRYGFSTGPSTTSQALSSYTPKDAANAALCGDHQAPRAYAPWPTTPGPYAAPHGSWP